MSKVFEALLKLERELGRLPPGVSIEAQQVLQSGSACVEPVLSTEGRPAAMPEPIEAEINHGTVHVEAELGFDLSQVRVDKVNVTPEARITYHTHPDGSCADRFRLLRMRLWPLWEAGTLKTLLVTSAQAQDGKSTVVMNLATALAEHGQRTVLVIEGDLYHPSLSMRLGIPGSSGLAECLERDEDPLSMLRRLDPLGWYLLPAGRAEGNPTELLQKPVLASIFEKLRTYFDWIIVDTPPVVPLTDTLSLRQCVDAGLLVVRAGRTPSDAVDDAIGRLGAGNLLGIVLNGSDELDRLYSDYRKSYVVRNTEKSTAS